MPRTFFSSIGDGRRSCPLSTVHCEDFHLFSSFPAGQGQTAVVCCARPAIHMAETDLSLLFSFWRLRNAIDGRAPGGVSWDSLGRKRWRGDGPEEGWSGIALAMLHSQNRWGPIRPGGPGCSRPPPVIFPGCPEQCGQLWSLGEPHLVEPLPEVCIFEASIFISRPLRNPWSASDEDELKWW